METELYKGKAVADKIKEDLRKRIAVLKEKNLQPKLCIIRVGANEDDLSYERGIRKNCDNLGIEAETLELPMDISQEDLEAALIGANQDPKIHGIMIFRPLPKHLDEGKISRLIDPEKDIDAMNPENLSRLFLGINKGFVPCTPQAVIELLDFYGFDFEGANVAILGRSLVVGKPLAMLFLEKNSTVTICHSRTKNTQEITKKADLVVAALGKAKMIDESYFTEDSIVVDVGINVDEDGKLCGDVDRENVLGKVKALTPVPGGIGSVTSTLLMEHIVRACENTIK
ncbi:MAG: bifunctional 5,10-methylenetetrahydrofolate dehydrogenase/5,10-methenyltetrahydrofolate cyclohydrolase [Bacillota bacterium]|nr:bifunctional 5,10-methylenetetrahydrofolate dehydrogenase/5,10-methenyltetrahydrofolate cyclohydrolase [Bacillota bacterium]